MFNDKFSDKSDLINTISQKDGLKRLFCNGGCSHLAKILFTDFTDKRKEKDLFLFCVIKKRSKAEEEKEGRISAAFLNARLSEKRRNNSKKEKNTPDIEEFDVKMYEDFVGEEKYFGLSEIKKQVIVDHVGFVSSGILYDGTGIFALNKEFEHEKFSKEKYNYYIISLKNKSSKESEKILNNMIESHALSEISKRNIFSRVMREIKYG